MFSEPVWNDRKEHTRGFVKGFAVGILVMALSVALFTAQRNGQSIGNKSAVVSSSSPTVTIEKNVATVKCPLSPDLMYPQGKKIVVSFANAKNEVDNHGCPAVIVHHSLPDQDLYFNALGCSATNHEVNFEVMGGQGCNKMLFKVTSQNVLTCSGVNCKGENTGGGWICSMANPGFKMVRKPAQLPYVRPSLATVAEAMELAVTNLTCPSYIIVSTNGQEEFAFQTPVRGVGDNAFIGAGLTTLPNGDQVMLFLYPPNVHGPVVARCQFLRQTNIGTPSFGVVHVTQWIGNGGVVDAATLNSLGVPFTDTFTCNPQSVKFVY